MAYQRKRTARNFMAEGLERLAKVATAEGDAEQAARLFGAAEALREAIGSPIPPADRADYDHGVAATRGALDEATFAAARADGRTMGLEHAIRYALRGR